MQKFLVSIQTIRTEMFEVPARDIEVARTLHPGTIRALGILQDDSEKEVLLNVVSSAD